MIDANILTRFTTNTDASGRFIVASSRTGRKYFVEPIGDPHIEWGSINPGAGSNAPLMHKKGDGKFKGSIEAHESLITEENGFKNIRMLDKGTSPLLAIDYIDSQYPAL